MCSRVYFESFTSAPLHERDDESAQLLLFEPTNGHGTQNETLLLQGRSHTKSQDDTDVRRKYVSELRTHT